MLPHATLPDPTGPALPPGGGMGGAEAAGAGEAAAWPHRAEAAADDDTRLALALIRHMVQPAVLMDPDGRVTLVNPAGQRLVTAQPARIVHGRFWWELWPHADRAELRAALADAAAGETVTVTLDCRRALASAALLVPVEGAGGRVARVLCLVRAR